MVSPMQFNANTTGEEAAEYFSKEIQNKVVLITGVSWGGLGAEVARVISKHGPKLLILAGRRQESIDETIAKIRAESSVDMRSLILDLASLESVRNAATQVNSYDENIDVLINNAAIMACPYAKTVDGFESQFGTNYLGPFLFTNLVLEKVLATQGRVVMVSSSAQAPIQFDDIGFSDGATYNEWTAYGQSKTAIISFARELSQRYKSRLTAFSLHPGGIKTNLQKHIDLDAVYKQRLKQLEHDPIKKAEFLEKNPRKTLAEGTSTHIVAAFDPDIAEQSGSYLVNAHVENKSASPDALDDDVGKKLWESSVKMVAL